jgi:LexA-binding, inner membrane-associated putative hydrolase
MSSPLGHALAGYAIGTMIARPVSAAPTPIVSTRGRILLFAGLGCLPDIDFLFRAHSMYTHSAGAVMVVALAAAIAFRFDWRAATACAAAYGSHLLLDWLGNDTSPPIGIMALWPFDSGYYQSPVPIFMPVTRRYWLPNFWRHNVLVACIEVALFGSLALAAHRHATKGGSDKGNGNRAREAI